MVGAFPLHVLVAVSVPIRWFQANNRDCLNHAKIQAEYHRAAVTSRRHWREGTILPLGVNTCTNSLVLPNEINMDWVFNYRTSQHCSPVKTRNVHVYIFICSISISLFMRLSRHENHVFLIQKELGDPKLPLILEQSNLQVQVIGNRAIGFAT